MNFYNLNISTILCIFCALCSFMPHIAYSQQTEVDIAGKVLLQEDEIIPAVGANVYWANTTTGTITDIDGHFSLARHPETTLLVFSYVGYDPDTLETAGITEFEITLKSIQQLEGVEITANRQHTYISTLGAAKSEVITIGELRKAACCNLSESFETNLSVDTDQSDAVSGAVKIRMLGLDGVYVQLLNEGVPTLRGLANTYGLSYIPGTWVKSISINKGSGSVMNGYEPITGQINICLQQPEQADRVLFNAYGNNFGRTELNLNLAHRLNSNLSSILMVSGAMLNTENDHNEDGFLDMPRFKNFHIANDWKYEKGIFRGQWGIKGTIDDRVGGQVVFDKKQPRTMENGYGLGANTRRAEFFSKTGFLLPRQNQSIALTTSATWHNQKSYFGLKDYEGTQQSLYTNLLFQTDLGSPKHQFKTGLSLLLDNYDETYVGTNYKRFDRVPGTFAEYTMSGDKATVVAGIRADYHNAFKWVVTPRIHAKYNINEQLIARFSAGKGFRIANIFAENAGFWASGRALNILESIRPEIAWNYGANLTQKFSLLKRDGYITADFYRTDFVNQIVVDAFSTFGELQIYNLRGKSFANSFQIEVFWEALRGLDVKAAYKMDDVKSTYGEKLLNVPFISRHKALFNVGYETPNNHWKFDATLQWHGAKQLTNTLQNSTEVEQKRSPDYTILNTQVTYLTKYWEFYSGVENLTNFTQHHPIINAENPFSTAFDATNIWGPIMGRIIYAGVRWTLPYKQN